MGRGVSKIGDRHLAFVQSIQTMAEHVRERKEKKQRVAQKVGELKSSVSELALNTIEFKEDPDVQERKMIIEKFLRIMNILPNSEEYEQQFRKFVDSYDLGELKSELEILEQIFIEEGGNLDELYYGIEEVARFDRNVDVYAEQFGEVLGLKSNGSRKLTEEEIRRMFRGLHKENEGFVRGSREDASGS